MSSDWPFETSPEAEDRAKVDICTTLGITRLRELMNSGEGRELTDDEFVDIVIARGVTRADLQHLGAMRAVEWVVVQRQIIAELDAEEGMTGDAIN